jgi:hypothetical protein
MSNIEFRLLLESPKIFVQYALGFKKITQTHRPKQLASPTNSKVPNLSGRENANLIRRTTIKRNKGKTSDIRAVHFLTDHCNRWRSVQWGLKILNKKSKKVHQQKLKHVFMTRANSRAKHPIKNFDENLMPTKKPNSVWKKKVQP